VSDETRLPLDDYADGILPLLEVRVETE
jgi:hypothetical protein